MKVPRRRWSVPRLGTSNRRFDMHPQYTPTDVSRFWSKVHRTDNPADCWEWHACKDILGYGYLRWLGKTCKAHRISWVMAFGPIPEGMCVLHRCDNPSCTNPAHLFLGTQIDNCRDRHAKGRTSHISRNAGESHGLSKLTEADVVAIRTRKAAGDTNTRLAREYGVSRRAVNFIVTRTNWSHVREP